MKIRKTVVGSTVAMTVAALGVGGVAATSAQAGTQDLATVLTSDNNRFDQKGGDYDVVTEAVLTVLDAKPDSAVSVLTDGSQKLTAFIPTDKAFRKLAADLTGKKKVKSERKAFKIVAGLGVDTVEQVLLYHVVPGAKVSAKKALKADGAKLTTAQGAKIKVKVKTHPTRIVLKDKEPDLKNAKVALKKTDINKGNKQIAHGIKRVMLPVDL